MMLQDDIAQCRLCAARFAATATAHVPRPVVWFDAGARILVAGQAPGARVHASGRPFRDASGDRLRDWMGIEAEAFYDRASVAIVPMAFCFPGYDAKGADLPPPAICAARWRTAVMAALPDVRLTLLVGGAGGWGCDAVASGARSGDALCGGLAGTCGARCVVPAAPQLAQHGVASAQCEV